MIRSTCIWSIIPLTFLWLLAAHAAGRESSALAELQVVEAYGHLPLSFEANQGQTDQRVRFLVRGNGYSLLLTANEAVLALRKKTGVTSQKSVAPPASAGVPQAVNFPLSFRSNAAELNANSAALNPERQAPAVLRMRLVGANAAAKVTGLEELPGKSNYFIGNDPGKWRTNVPNYAMVKYADVYPGVDLVYYGNQGQLEYDLVVQPGADLSRIAFDIRVVRETPGAHHDGPLRVDANGNLVVGTEGGEVIFHKPVVYQLATNYEPRPKELIDGKYILTSGHEIRFQVGAHDPSKPLVIDPTLAYSTYLGGSGIDFGQNIAVDASGNAYVTGLTLSSDFPITTGAFQTTLRGGEDAFVSKLNANGSALLYSTYLGGSGTDFGQSIALDALGNAYVTGGTGSTDFPTTTGAFQITLPGVVDAFVSKLNADGSALLYSTYLGGSGTLCHDFGQGIALDGSGNAYVTGAAGSSDFPTTAGTLQTTSGGGCGDAFVSKLNVAGSALLYSTYLGGAQFDQGTGIAVDASGNAYVTGYTGSSNFPITAGAFQTSFGGGPLGSRFDAFVSKLNADGSALVYSTYLGGRGFDQGTSIVIDESGNGYVTGHTLSPNFPTTAGAFKTIYPGGDDAFVSKLNADGSALVYSTYLGGSGTNFSISPDFGIAVDASGEAYVTGRTDSSNFPTTPGAFQTTFGGRLDAFVSKLNAVGSALVYSSYLGGSGLDGGSRIALDALGNAYITGSTGPGCFPSCPDNFPTTTGALQTTFGGGFDDAFVSKFSFGIPFSSFSGKLELDAEDGSFNLNARFTLGAGGIINPPTQPVSLMIGSYSVTIPGGSFVKHSKGYAFEGVINGVSLEVLIKFGSTPGSYMLLAEGEGANLKGTTNPVTVTLSIGNELGTTQMHAEFE